MYKPHLYFDFLKDNVLGTNVNTFRDALIAHSAVIAGGSVLKVYSESTSNYNWRNTDIDIYVHQKNAAEFIKSIGHLLNFNMKSHAAPAYCMSFFRKNHILSRLTGTIGGSNVPCDIMIVDNSYSIEHVVTNFDLTFCEIWYDGKDVRSTEDVGKKHGFLRDEYKDSLFKYNNYFIQGRIRKYTERGFKIDLKKSREPLYLEFNHNKDYKVIDNPEEWVVKLIINNIFDYQKNKKEPVVNEHATALATFMCHFKAFTIAELENNLRLYLLSHITRSYGARTLLSLKAVYVHILRKFYRLIPDDYAKYVKKYIEITASDIK
jgi:hypothetical protein